jgi:hypothetical protein
LESINTPIFCGGRNGLRQKLLEERHEMTEDEQIVREAWSKVRMGYGPGNVHQKPSQRLCYVMVTVSEGKEECIGSGTEAEALAAAHASTNERKRQIAEIEEEIAFLQSKIDEAEPEDHLIDLELMICKRIPPRLQAELGEMKKGWKL